MKLYSTTVFTSKQCDQSAHLLKKLQQQTRDTLATCQSAVYLTNDIGTLQQVKQQAQMMYQALVNSASIVSSEGLHTFLLLSKAAKAETRSEQKKQLRSTLPKRLQRRKDPLIAATVPSRGRPKQKRMRHLTTKIATQVSIATRLLRKARLRKMKGTLHIHCIDVLDICHYRCKCTRNSCRVSFHKYAAAYRTFSTDW